MSGLKRVMPCVLAASAVIASGGAALAVTTGTADACAFSGAHDVKTFTKTTVCRTYVLPRDSAHWQYRVVRSHKRVYGCGYAGGQGRKGIYLSKGM